MTDEALKQEVHREWEAAAAGYAKWDEVLAAGLTGPTDLMLDLAGVEPGMRILDLACGTGGQTLLAAERVGPGGQVIAADISAAMLAHTSERAAQAGFDTIETLETAAEDLNAPAESFDAAICRLGLMLFPDPEAGLAAVARVLKPEAKFAAIVFSTPAANPYMAESMGILRDHAGKPPPPPRDPGVFALGEPGLLEGLLEAAGFTDVGARIMRAPLRLVSAGDAVEMMREAFGAFRAVISDLGQSEQEAAWGKVGDYLSSLEGPNGFEVERSFIVASGAKRA
jgi:ubiquinone/menaquinone biosynthesis C-methylase UbiE